MGAMIKEKVLVSVVVGETTLQEGVLYAFLTTDGTNEIGVYSGIERGHLVFKPLLGDSIRKVKSRSIVEVRQMA